MKNDLRTPLARVRGLGSAKSGTEHFWHQRLTAIANVPLTLFLVGLIVALHGRDYATVEATLSSIPVALVLLGLLLSLAWHMKLGMQVVIEDYVHSEGTRFLLLTLNTFVSVAVGLISAFAVLKLAFGA